MKLAFDTSVLVAALVEAHADHRRTRPWIEAIAAGDAAAQATWHAAAETWSVLTRLPGALRLPPSTATLVIDRLLEVFQPTEVTGEIYRAALRRCGERGAGSGAIFDALHLASAESHRVDGFVTFNRSDFERLRAAGSPPIVVPPDPPAFTL